MPKEDAKEVCMFIVAWVIILVLRANSVLIPHPVSFIIGALAICEAAIYSLYLLFAMAVASGILRQARKK